MDHSLLTTGGCVRVHSVIGFMLSCIGVASNLVRLDVTLSLHLLFPCTDTQAVCGQSHRAGWMWLQGRGIPLLRSFTVILK